MKQQVIFTDNIREVLAHEIGQTHDRIFVLTDETTRQLCWPRVSDVEQLRGAHMVTIPAGDNNKNLQSTSHVWQELSEHGATRHSLLVNLGGGMVTDLGGFAASTFKRGIRFINIPTTLLSMVDASVGGKTGINFGGLKNEVGTFCDASCVVIDTGFLRTLDRDNILSGYAEMLKHGLISDKETWADLMNFDIEAIETIEAIDAIETIETIETIESRSLAGLLATSVAVKERIVSEDPHEQGIRKALNLGHTIGHAIESFYQGQLLHGHCVAYGLVCELYLSCLKTGFPVDIMRQTVRFIREHYGTPAITCNDYPTLLSLMRHDKKNTAGHINFTLLADIGDIRINQLATDEEISEALDFLREG